MSAPTSVEQLCNIALSRIGYPDRIGSIYDGTKQARVALDLYAQTRDDVLRQKNWPFAFQTIAGTVAGAPPDGWSFSWAYPAQCIRIRTVLPSSLALPTLDPQPLLWELYNDGTTLRILTQVSPVTINYIGQIVDMTQWTPGFIEALISSLAMKFGPSLRKMGEQAINPREAIDEAIGASESQAPDDVMAMPEQGRRQ